MDYKAFDDTCRSDARVGLKHRLSPFLVGRVPLLKFIIKKHVGTLILLPAIPLAFLTF